MRNYRSDTPISDLSGVPKAWEDLCMAGMITRKNAIASSNELYKIRDRLGVSDAVVNNTVDIYRKAVENGLVKKVAVSAVIAAAMYAACKEAGIIKTLNDVAIAANVNRNNIMRHYKILISGLEMDMIFLDPIQCIPRIADLVGAPDSIRLYAIEILRKAADHQFTVGKYPMALAATAIYMSYQENGHPKTQKEISEAAGISRVTLRKNHRGIIDSIGRWIGPNGHSVAGFPAPLGD